ncbi:HSF-type DNA-binding protein [Nitzschia inconspicua]|uniref:HSF-type DNA-binding protein n=1 Tax=Nitzschia inconspicua TaxID=303405 RepID=A0A9K3KAZ0_9STRA|nr:HSF-type DNA-binding protein [Nitzschia inconspicua]
MSTGRQSAIMFSCKCAGGIHHHRLHNYTGEVEAAMKRPFEGNSGNASSSRRGHMDAFSYGYAAPTTTAPFAMSPSMTTEGIKTSPSTPRTWAFSDLATDPEMLFPDKLYIMLHDASEKGFDDIVAWGNDSPRGFKVHKKREFERLVLPKYFKMTKYKSFTRQLHNYAFSWIRTGNDKGGYYHPSFDRHDRGSCASIARRDHGSSMQAASTAGTNLMLTNNRLHTNKPTSVMVSSMRMIDRTKDIASRIGGGDEEEHNYHHRDPAYPYYDGGDDSFSVSIEKADQHASWQDLQHPQQLHRPMVQESAVSQEILQNRLHLSNNPMYPEEEKLHLAYTSATASALAQAPHPHPLESLFEPRTIEEMMLDPNTRTMDSMGRKQSSSRGNPNTKKP